MINLKKKKKSRHRVYQKRKKSIKLDDRTQRTYLQLIRLEEQRKVLQHR